MKRASPDGKQRALVVMNAHMMTPNFRAIQRRLVAKLGIELVADTECDKAVDVFDALLTLSSTASGAAVDASLARQRGVRLTDDVRLVRADWLYESVRSRRRLDCADFAFARAGDAAGPPLASAAAAAAAAARPAAESAAEFVRVLSWRVGGLARLLDDPAARAAWTRSLQAHEPNLVCLQRTLVDAVDSDGVALRLRALLAEALGGAWHAQLLAASARGWGGLAVLSRFQLETLDLDANPIVAPAVDAPAVDAPAVAVSTADAPPVAAPRLSTQLVRAHVGAGGARASLEGVEAVCVLNVGLPEPAVELTPAEAHAWARALRGRVEAARAAAPELASSTPLVVCGAVRAGASLASALDAEGEAGASALGRPSDASLRRRAAELEALVLDGADLADAFEVVCPPIARMLAARDARGCAPCTRVHGEWLSRAHAAGGEGAAAELGGRAARGGGGPTARTAWALHAPAEAHAEDVPPWHAREEGGDDRESADSAWLSRLARCRLSSAHLALDPCGAADRAVVVSLRLRARLGGHATTAATAVAAATLASTLSYPLAPEHVANPGLSAACRRLLAYARGLLGRDRLGLGAGAPGAKQLIVSRALAYERRAANVAAIPAVLRDGDDVDRISKLLPFTGGAQQTAAFRSRRAAMVARAGAVPGAEWSAETVERLAADVADGTTSARGARPDPLAPATAPRARAVAALEKVLRVGNASRVSMSDVEAFATAETRALLSAGTRRGGGALDAAELVHGCGATSVAAAQLLAGLAPSALALGLCDAAEAAELAALGTPAPSAVRALRARLHPTARWGLRNYDDLNGEFERGEALEMREALAAAVGSFGGCGEWLVQPVGGRRRGASVRTHDAHFLLTARGCGLALTDAALAHVVDELVRAGRVLPGPADADARARRADVDVEWPLFMLATSKTAPAARAGDEAAWREFGQAGVPVDPAVYAQCLHVRGAREHSADSARGNMDSHSRFFGIYRTAAEPRRVRASTSSSRRGSSTRSRSSAGRAAGCSTATCGCTRARTASTSTRTSCTARSPARRGSSRTSGRRGSTAARSLTASGPCATRATSSRSSACASRRPTHATREPW